MLTKEGCFLLGLYDIVLQRLLVSIFHFNFRLPPLLVAKKMEPTSSAIFFSIPLQKIGFFSSFSAKKLRLQSIFFFFRDRKFRLPKNCSQRNFNPFKNFFPERITFLKTISDRFLLFSLNFLHFLLRQGRESNPGHLRSKRVRFPLLRCLLVM